MTERTLSEASTHHPIDRERGHAVTIGTFDGVHLGHRKLIAHLARRARDSGLVPAVVTFWPHPRNVLAGPGTVQYLATLEDRIRYIRESGVEDVRVIRFDQEFSRLSARDFFERINEQLTLKLLVVGENFRAGHKREAGIPEFRELGDEMGWSVGVFPPVMLDDERVSSSRIRGLLAQAGDVDLAGRMLGRSYDVSGVVVPGAGRGGTLLGVPTANIEVEDDLLVPRNGVYCCSVEILGAEGGEIPSAVSVGIRPTFDSGPRTVEAFLLDWSGNLYGKRLRLRFYAWLRDELKFDSVDALVEQMNRDIEQVRSLMASR